MPDARIALFNVRLRCRDCGEAFDEKVLLESIPCNGRCRREWSFPELVNDHRVCPNCAAFFCGCSARNNDSEDCRCGHER
jgi:hypothetical protein